MACHLLTNMYPDFMWTLSYYGVHTKFTLPIDAVRVT